MITLEKQQIAKAKRRATGACSGTERRAKKVKTRSREKTTRIAGLLFYKLLIKLEKNCKSKEKGGGGLL